METTTVRIPPDFERFVYRTLTNRDNTLDDAQLETRCPLDNGRHDCTPVAASFIVAATHFDRIPPEIIVEVLLLLDIPSLTRFRVVSRRSMELVNSVRQYTAIIQHCPDIIRAIVSIQADGFDCSTLFRTLCTSRCSTCNRFGYYLYLIACRRVCYFCFIRRPEYFPLTRHEAYKFYNALPTTYAKSAGKLLKLANPPSILSLPGRYCSAWTTRGGNVRPKRIRLYDRLGVVRYFDASCCFPQTDNTTREPKRFMAIITAPVLLNAGREVDHGFFCRACRDESEGEISLFRVKYTAEDMPGHIAKYGPIVETTQTMDPSRFKHVKSQSNFAAG